ncbi:hypothetical protein CK203_020942 [Vitis vinifera]|uniref:Ubiquitin-like protease family profile domain-containing protein n=1 Tax=Vitis vinifera TaxID=29760 RepID=A0A438JWZ3_VITVI|nr:hypothetical protein CK203_020942 [Vitis vinifera]
MPLRKTPREPPFLADPFLPLQDFPSLHFPMPNSSNSPSPLFQPPLHSMQPTDPSDFPHSFPCHSMQPADPSNFPYSFPCAINPHRGCRPVLSIEEGASLTIRLMDASNRIYCYIFMGGKLVQKNDGQWEYLGGRSKGIHIYKGMAFEEFTKKIIEKFDISLHVMKMHYTLKFNPRVIQDLEDEDDLDNVASHSDDFANVYLVDLPSVEAIEANIPNSQLAFRDPPITFPSSNASCDPIPKTMMLSRGSGHTFKNAEEFRNAIYQMSLGGRFEYKYKKNSPTHMSVKCSVDGCPWKIIAHAIEGNVILRVHTYQVNHNHIAQDECSSKVKVSSKRGAVVVEDVFRTTPDYLPHDGMFPLALGVIDIRESCVVFPSCLGQENHAYCYRHVKENFSSFFNKQNIRGKKGKEDALLLLDSIAYARLEIDYNEAFEKLVRFNENLAKWVAENNPEHWAMSKFLKKRWDKMTTNIAEEFNVWLREEHHQTIYTLLLMHMDKLVAMLDTHMCVCYPIWEGRLRCLLERFICCRYESTYVYLHDMANVRFAMCTHLIYSGQFQPLPTHNMLKLCDDGSLQDCAGNSFPAFQPPHHWEATESASDGSQSIVTIHSAGTNPTFCHQDGPKRAAAIVFDGDLDPRHVVDAFCRMLQFDDESRTKLFLSPYIAEMVMRSNAKHLTHDAILVRFDPYMYAFDGSYQNVTQVYLPVLFKNHWTLYVYDLHNKRIQLLDSRPGRKRSCMSGIQQNLAKVVLLLVADKKEMVAVDLNMYSFVMLDVPCQPNDNDCGVFIMKFMDNWSNGGLSKSIDVAKIKKYRLKLPGRLLLSSHNAHQHRLWQFELHFSIGCDEDF